MGVNGWFGNWSSSNEGYASGSFITEASINGTSATETWWESIMETEDS